MREVKELAQGHTAQRRRAGSQAMGGPSEPPGLGGRGSRALGAWLI